MFFIDILPSIRNILHLYFRRIMNTKKLCISLRPKIYEIIVKQAKKRQVSLSRCIKDQFEFEPHKNLLPSQNDAPIPIQTIQSKG